MRTILKTGAVAALFGALALTPLSGALAQVRETPPVGGTPKNFALPKIETYSLRNGVQVTLVPYGRVPKATVRAVVRAGNLNDGDQPWLADLTGDMMKEGAAGETSKALALKAAGMGGDLNIGVGLDETFATLDVLSERVPDALGLIADVLQYPALPESELARLKQNLLRRLSVASTRAQSIAQQAFYSGLYPDHPYGVVLPDPKTVASYGIDDVKAFYAANFGGRRTHIYVVGQFDSRATKRAVDSAFSKWRKGAKPLDRPATTAKAPFVTLIDRPGAVQSTVRLGKRVPPISADVKLPAANTLLGGYFSSRITMNIREDKGYTYSPRSRIRTVYEAADWEEDADITSEATGPALTEIYSEIRRLQSEPPSAAELAAIQNYMSGIFVLQLASRGGLAGRLAFVNLHGLGLKYLENYVGSVRALTVADLQKAAADNLPVGELSLVVVGDLASVRPQLEALPELKGRLPAAE